MTGPVAVVGLGLMGRPGARRLREAGWDVRGWTRCLLPTHLAGAVSLTRQAVEQR